MLQYMCSLLFEIEAIGRELLQFLAKLMGFRPLKIRNVSRSAARGFTFSTANNLNASRSAIPPHLVVTFTKTPEAISYEFRHSENVHVYCAIYISSDMRNESFSPGFGL